MSVVAGDYYLRRNLDRLPSGRSELPWLMVYRPFEYACLSSPDSGMLVATMRPHRETRTTSSSNMRLGPPWLRKYTGAFFEDICKSRWRSPAVTRSRHEMNGHGILTNDFYHPKKQQDNTTTAYSSRVDTRPTHRAKNRRASHLRMPCF